VSAISLGLFALAVGRKTASGREQRATVDNDRAGYRNLRCLFKALHPSTAIMGNAVMAPSKRHAILNLLASRRSSAPTSSRDQLANGARGYHGSEIGLGFDDAGDMGALP
jgi:hypothetical protein